MAVVPVDPPVTPPAIDAAAPLDLVIRVQSLEVGIVAGWVTVSAGDEGPPYEIRKQEQVQLSDDAVAAILAATVEVAPNPPMSLEAYLELLAVEYAEGV